MKLKSIFIVFIVLIIFCISHGDMNSSYAFTEWKQYFSVQVKAYPQNESEKAINLYNALKRKNYLVYYCKTKIKDNWWIRIRVGCFSDKSDAYKFGQRIKEEQGLEFLVIEGNVLVDQYKDQFKVITTPSGIWLQSGSTLVEIYPFRKKVYHAGILEETKALVSPLGEDIVFLYDHKIIKCNIITKENDIIVDEKIDKELIRSSPKWSPDGQYIAYMDCNEWEMRTNIWLIKSDGSDDTCIVKMDNSDQERVKSFSWHPRKNEIFYLKGYAFGPPSGGNLYVTKINGERDLVAQTKPENRLKIFEFRMADDGVHITLAQFKENELRLLKKRLHIKISYSKLYEGVIITPEMLSL